MFCGKCGCEIYEENTFCGKCGAKVTNTCAENVEFAPFQNSGSPIPPKTGTPKWIVLVCTLMVCVTVGFTTWLIVDNNDDPEDTPRTSKQSEEEEELSKFETVKAYIEKNGRLETYEENYNDGYDIYSVSYDQEKNCLDFTCVSLEDIDESELENYQYENIKFLTTIYIDENSSKCSVSWFYNITDNSKYSATSNLDKGVFSKSNNTMENVNISGLIDYRHYDITKSMFESDVLDTIESAGKLLNDNNTGVSLKDLGFGNF